MRKEKRGDEENEINIGRFCNTTPGLSINYMQG